MVNGTDFGACKQKPFCPGWWPFKLNRAAVRYEIAISIPTGWIVWINGPFPARLYSNWIAIECGLLDNLRPGEKVIVDSGYHGHNDIFVRPRGVHNNYKKMKSDSRAHHKAINCMFKEWNILQNCFRYSIQKHGIVFGAIANIIWMCIELEVCKPFMVHYDDTHIY